jgi:hypothetical protein
MSVHGGADLKNKLMGVMVFFLTCRKINKSVMHPILGTETLLIQLFNFTSNTMNLLYNIHMYLSTSLDSTTRMGSSLPCWRDRLAFFSTWHGYATPCHSLGLAWLPGVGLPQFLLLIFPLQAVHAITHTSFHTVITWGLNYSIHTQHYEHMTLYICIQWIMVSLFVLPCSHQAGRLAPTPHIRNNRVLAFAHRI